MKVLYVAGFGRSGSTILGNILGQLDGFFHAGEVFALWYRLPDDDPVCGCGAPIKECSVWRSIFRETFGNLADPQAKTMLRSHAGRNRSIYLPLMLFPGGRKILGFWTKEHARHLQKLYWAIRERARAKVIIDSSKLPSYGCVLDMMSSIDLYVVHLIRDARAVTYSWLRDKLREDTGEPMARYSAVGSSLRWNVQNLAAELLWRRHPDRYLMLRYEDFVRSPNRALRRILDLIGERSAAMPLVNDHIVHLDATHTIDGNPSRVRTGDVAVGLDNEWASHMEARQKILTTSLTWPLLKHYGYPADERPPRSAKNRSMCFGGMI
jgi:hypothetical protein